MNHRRAKQKAKRELLLSTALSAVDSLDQTEILSFLPDIPYDSSSIVDWETLPSALDPFYRETSKLPQGRAMRKRQQLESILYHALPLMEDGDTVCDFGAGAGHIALLLAYLRPSCRVVIVEHNPEKHQMVQSRLEHLKTNGVDCSLDIYSTIDDFEKSGRPLDLGVSLHSCGLLTDSTLEYCVRKRSKYILVPCCYGQIASVVPHFNRSTSSIQFRSVEQSSMAAIQSAADYTVKASDENFHHSHHFSIAKRCMSIVDSDRQSWAKENNYTNLSIQSLQPLSCSPKNNMIIGMPIPCANSFPFAEKNQKIAETFAEFIPGNILAERLVLPSPTCYYRLRCRLGVTIECVESVYLFSYFVYGDGEKKKIDKLDLASIPIQSLMEEIKQIIMDYSDIFHHLEAIHFLDTLSGDKLVSFIYSKAIPEEAWRSQAKSMQERLLQPHVGFMGRSKKQKVFLEKNRDFVTEVLRLKNGREIAYKQYEGSFSNPNGRINERCLDWLVSCSRDIVSRFPLEQRPVNLLELYCGCGNHTMALSSVYDKIIAVELDKKLCDAAEFNAEVNGISERITVLQIHSEKFCKSILQERRYKETDCHVVLADPPRAGLDTDTLNRVSHFPYILYISCNPTSLLRDLKQTLHTTHKVIHFALFDQFAATQHMEVAVCLEKR